MGRDGGSIQAGHTTAHMVVYSRGTLMYMVMVAGSWLMNCSIAFIVALFMERKKKIILNKIYLKFIFPQTQHKIKHKELPKNKKKVFFLLLEKQDLTILLNIC